MALAESRPLPDALLGGSSLTLLENKHWTYFSSRGHAGRAERRQSRGPACPHSAHRLADVKSRDMRSKLTYPRRYYRRRVTFGTGKVEGGVRSRVLPPPYKDG